MDIKKLPSGCWECTSHYRCDSGYVRIKVNGRLELGHRYMYEEKNGKIEAEVIRHTCDNRWCVNPDHLIEGSHSDNVQDRVSRGRSAKGTANGRSKLNEESVLRIFEDQETSITELAKLYEVDPKTIRKVKQGKTWQHITSK